MLKHSLIVAFNVSQLLLNSKWAFLIKMWPNDLFLKTNTFTNTLSSVVTLCNQAKRGHTETCDLLWCVFSLPSAEESFLRKYWLMCTRKARGDERTLQHFLKRSIKWYMIATHLLVCICIWNEKKVPIQIMFQLNCNLNLQALIT